MDCSTAICRLTKINILSVAYWPLFSYRTRPPKVVQYNERLKTSGRTAPVYQPCCLLQRRFYWFHFYRGFCPQLVYTPAQTFLYAAVLVICACMVSSLCSDGYICLSYLAKRHQGPSGQRESDNIYHSIILEYCVVVCFLWIEIIPVRTHRHRTAMDGHIADDHQLLPYIQNRFPPPAPVYYLGKLRHCA